MATDARTYYRMASIAAEQGMATIPRDRGSPEFVVLFALWMRLIGQSPMAAFAMNIVAYTCMSGLVVARFRPKRRGHEWPCLLVMVSYTFSPALLLHGSQPLKDELFVYIVGLALLGASVFLPRMIDGAKSVIRPRAAWFAFVAVGAALYMIAGIRVYYALILWAALAAVFVVGGFRQPLTRLLRVLWRGARSARRLVDDLLNRGRRRPADHAKDRFDHWRYGSSVAYVLDHKECPRGVRDHPRRNKSGAGAPHGGERSDE